MMSKKKYSKSTPHDVFSSADRFIRLTRVEIADYMNDTLIEKEFKPLSGADDRLTDQVCYEFVNSYTDNFNADEATEEVILEFGRRHFDV